MRILLQRDIFCASQQKLAFSLNLPSTTSFRILLIDENPIRIAILEEGLREAGQTDITVIDDMTGLVNKIYALDPDVVIIDLENPSRDVLEQMFQVSRVVKRPIAMFVDQTDSRSIAASVEAGVSAYIVDGLKKERVMPILEMAVSRFNAFEKLQAELEETRLALEGRKRIDKAKGILMKTREIDEETAYRLMRRTAMEQNKRIIEIADSIISGSEFPG